MIETEPVTRDSYINGHQHGSYWCRCSSCEKTFDGKKRCIICFECAALGEINKLRAELRAIKNQALWDAAFSALHSFARVGAWLVRLRAKAPPPIDGIYWDRQNDQDMITTFVDDRGIAFGLTRKNFIDAHYAAMREPEPKSEPPRDPWSDNPAGLKSPKGLVSDDPPSGDPLCDNADYGTSGEQNTNTLD